MAGFYDPGVPDGRSWLRLNVPEASNAQSIEFANAYAETSRSLLLFVLKREENRNLRRGLDALLDVSEHPVAAGAVGCPLC